LILYDADVTLGEWSVDSTKILFFESLQIVNSSF